MRELDACKLCWSFAHIGKPCPWESKWDPRNVGCNIQGISCCISCRVQASNSKVEQETGPNTLLLIQNIISENNEVLTFWDNSSTISLISKKYARRNRPKGVKVSYEW